MSKATKKVRLFFSSFFKGIPAKPDLAAAKKEEEAPKDPAEAKKEAEKFLEEYKGPWTKSDVRDLEQIIKRGGRQSFFFNVA